MKITKYEWNSFDEAKPNDGDVILIKHIDLNSKPRIIQYFHGISIEYISKLPISNLEDFRWTNFDNNEKNS